jgi:hypothetical protein
MNRDDIIRMAEQCGIPEFENNESQAENILRFATLVADAEAKRIHDEGMVTIGHMREQILAEREACAKVCESLSLEWEDQPNIAQAELATMMDCALAIRARGDHAVS